MTVPPSSTLILRRSGSTKSTRSGIGASVTNVPLGSRPSGPCCHESPIVAPIISWVRLVRWSRDGRRPVAVERDERGGFAAGRGDCGEAVRADEPAPDAVDQGPGVLVAVRHC